VPASVTAGGSSGSLAFSTGGFAGGLWIAFGREAGKSMPALRGISLDCVSRNACRLSAWFSGSATADWGRSTGMETLSDELLEGTQSVVITNGGSAKTIPPAIRNGCRSPQRLTGLVWGKDWVVTSAGFVFLKFFQMRSRAPSRFSRDGLPNRLSA